MKKQAEIRIVDAKRTIKSLSATKTKLQAYRVKSVGKNGETLQTSEVLNDVKAVKTHIAAMLSLWGLWHKSEYPSIDVYDKTRLQKFAASNYAHPNK